VEPVDGRGELGQQQRRPVAALDVRELVQEDDAAALDGPVAGGAAEQEQGLEQTRRHGDRHRGALDQGHLARQLETLCGGVALVDPFPVADRFGLAGNPANA
jgi:hypothetical protein